MTKKTSTPTKPPPTPGRSACWRTTPRMASARRSVDVGPVPGVDGFEAFAASHRRPVGARAPVRPWRGVRARLDYRRYGAVPLLGVDGAVFVGHGRSDEAAVASAVRSAQQAVQHGMMAALMAGIADTPKSIAVDSAAPSVEDAPSA